MTLPSNLLTPVSSISLKSSQVPSLRHTPVSPLWGHPLFLNPAFFPNIHTLVNSHPINLSTEYSKRTISIQYLYFLTFCSYVNQLSQVSMTDCNYSCYLQQIWTAKFKRYFSVSTLLDFFIDVYKTGDSHFLKISLPSGPVLSCPSSSFPISLSILLLPVLEFPPSLPIPLNIFVPGFTS